VLCICWLHVANVNTKQETTFTSSIKTHMPRMQGENSTKIQYSFRSLQYCSMGLEGLTNNTKVYRQDRCPGQDVVFTELPCKYFSTAGKTFISFLYSKKQDLATADFMRGNREMSCIRFAERKLDLPKLGTSWRREINVTAVQGDGGGKKLCVDNCWKETCLAT